MEVRSLSVWSQCLFLWRIVGVSVSVVMMYVSVSVPWCRGVDKFVRVGRAGILCTAILLDRMNLKTGGLSPHPPPVPRPITSPVIGYLTFELSDVIYKQAPPLPVSDPAPPCNVDYIIQIAPLLIISLILYDPHIEYKRGLVLPIRVVIGSQQNCAIAVADVVSG